MAMEMEVVSRAGDYSRGEKPALARYRLPDWFLAHNVKTLAQIDALPKSIALSDDHTKDEPKSASTQNPQPKGSPDEPSCSFPSSLFSELRDITASLFMRDHQGRLLSPSSAAWLALPSNTDLVLVPGIMTELARDIRCDLISIGLEDLEDLALEFHLQDRARDTSRNDGSRSASEDPKQSFTSEQYFAVPSQKHATSDAWEKSKSVFDTVFDAFNNKLDSFNTEDSQRTTSLPGSGDDANGTQHRHILIMLDQASRILELEKGHRLLARLRDFIQQRRELGEDISLLVTVSKDEDYIRGNSCPCPLCSTSFDVSDKILFRKIGADQSSGMVLKSSGVQTMEPDGHADYIISINIRRLMRRLRAKLPDLLPPEVFGHHSDMIKGLLHSGVQLERTLMWSMTNIQRAATQIIGRAWRRERLTVRDISVVLLRLGLVNPTEIEKEREPQRPNQLPDASDQPEDEPESWADKKMRFRWECNTAEREVLDCLVDPDTLRTSFDDVIIDEQVKSAVKSLISLSTSCSKVAPNSLLSQVSMQGLLFYGPPGTGKTHLARAIAKECGASMLELDAAVIQSKFVSESENNIKASFKVASMLFPCILFIDEVDALFYRRNSEDKSWQRSQLTQFLKEMDGLAGNEKAPIVVVATNRPQDLDEAFLRRLPRKIYFGLPDVASREKILQVLLKTESLDPSLDTSSLAKKTEGYSGSDLRNLCGDAALTWATDNSDRQPTPVASGSPINIRLGASHFAQALKTIRPSVSPKSVQELLEFYSRFNPSGVQQPKLEYDVKQLSGKEESLTIPTPTDEVSLAGVSTEVANHNTKSEAPKTTTSEVLTSKKKSLGAWNFPQSVEGMQDGVRHMIKARGLPMFNTGRWRRRSQRPGQNNASLPAHPPASAPTQVENSPLGTQKIPDWMRSLGLLSPDVRGLDDMMKDMGKLAESMPKESFSVVSDYLASFGPETQKNMQELANEMKDMLDGGLNMAENRLPNFHRKFKASLYRVPPRPELAICLKCRLSGHFINQCTLFQDLGDDDPDSNTVGRIVQLLDGELPPLPRPRRVQLRSLPGSEIQVCENCRAIPLSSLFPAEGDDDDDQIHIFEDYGHITSVFFRQDCPLCVLLVNSTPDTVKSLDAYVMVYSLLNIGRQLGNVHRQVQLPSRIMGLGVVDRPYRSSSWGLWESSGLNRLNEAPEAVGLIEKTPSPGKQAYLGGRLLSADALEVGLVYDWIGRCDEKHARTCIRLNSPELKRIRLIDVTQRKVVPFPHSQGCEYIALSYVWGGYTQPTIPNNSSFGPLPATLEDAITATKLLRKRFLWVDAICIDQSDPADKAAQIPLMDLVYSNAWLTIVALSGETANSGLFGSSREQLSCEISGNTFVTTFSTLQQQISDSVWGTRAWTLQESLLSPRSLFFSKDQLYFLCNSSSSCEAVDDANSPYHVMDTLKTFPYFGSGDVLFRNPFVNFDANDLEHIGAGPISVQSRLEDYGRLLKQYMCRRMSHDSDALHAFQGVLKLLTTHLYPGGFFQGLPIEDLPLALLWEPAGLPRRRHGFPAWSWAGWEAQLSSSHAFDGKGGSKSQESSWRRPFVEIHKSAGGRLELLHSSGPSDTGPALSHYSSAPDLAATDVPTPREVMPPDPFWNLYHEDAQDPAYPTDSTLDGEQSTYLFIECITITLRVGLQDSIQDVTIGETKCRLAWQTQREGWEDDVSKRSERPQEFLVLARLPNQLRLLLVDIDGSVATRVVSAHLHIPSLDNEMSGNQFSGLEVAAASLSGILNAEGHRFDRGKLNFLNESWEASVLSTAGCLKRRRLVLK